MVDLSVESARAALLHPEVQSIITTETVDVVVTLPGREGLVALCLVLRGMILFIIMLCFANCGLCCA